MEIKHILAYIVTGLIDDIPSGVVLCEVETYDPDYTKYVTWNFKGIPKKTSTQQNNFFWGHYFETKDNKLECRMNAYKDFIKRGCRDINLAHLEKLEDSLGIAETFHLVSDFEKLDNMEKEVDTIDNLLDNIVVNYDPTPEQLLKYSELVSKKLYKCHDIKQQITFYQENIKAFKSALAELQKTSAAT